MYSSSSLVTVGRIGSHMNNQIISSSRSEIRDALEIIDVFKTIQGEGPLAGYPAIFVRLADCNLRCPGCDTDYTTGKTRIENDMLLNRILELLLPAGINIVVITGGEPFRQNISILINKLAAIGIVVQIETNGTLPPPTDLHESVVVVCSPKTGKINPKLVSRLDALKYVMHEDSVGDDGLPIKVLDHSVSGQVARPPDNFKGAIYLQPMDSQDEAQNQRNLQAVLKSCLKFGYILQLQIHKIIGVD